ncbi:pancreatic triacylglycerol lipase-like isoform X2 [Lineus longissimus]|uniref:pancreatic triacylglycerol lipase-like isoform X2 n=1 Tax=Lineus longissimus TaxID=88925 RepID=UPI002B4DDAAF
MSWLRLLPLVLVIVWDHQLVEAFLNSNGHLELIGSGLIPVTKCYGVLGCMSTGGVFSDLSHRPLQLLPLDRDKIQTTFHLFTKRNHQSEQILVADNNVTITNSMFDPTKETKVIVHGFIDNGRLPWVLKIKDEYLKKDDYNVIVVDWGKGSMFPYTQATANTRLVGAEIAYLIQTMQTVVAAVPELFHIIGHSLGAHIAGYAGERLRFLGRITALDPADPYFSGTDIAVRLDPSDALFVDVIHTDAEPFIAILTNEGGFGMRSPTGHVDFYPNGGLTQPGCDNDVTAILIEGLYEGGKRFVACDHLRAYEFFTDSINNICKYKAYPCKSDEDFKAGRCTRCNSTVSGCSYMGEDAIRSRPPPGQEKITYYLETGGDAPLFCRYEVFVRVQLSTDASKERGKLRVNVKGSNGIDTGMTLLHTDANQDFSPGTSYFFVIKSRADIGKPSEVQLMWEHNPSWLKPWQWGPLYNAKLNIDKITVVDGESQQTSELCYPLTIDDGTQVSFDEVSCLH